MAKAKKVKYSKKVAEFICSKMEEEGLLVEQVCRKYPDDTPHPKTVYKWGAENTEFAARLNTAYTVWLMARVMEMETISTKPACELWPDLDFKEAEATRKARLDTLKFTLGKMAPILSKRFNTKQVIEHSGTVDAPQILITNYSTPELTKGITIDEDKE